MPTFTLAKNPVGFRQLAVSSSAVALSSATGGVPANAKRAVITVETNDIRWRDDGIAPTTSVGMLAKSTTIFELPSIQSINGFKAIHASADGLIDITYYGA